jgi:apolipoprotein N-acyltransferase
LITASLPTVSEASFVTGSALLTILSFPDFDLWFLAWISVAPLLIVVTQAINSRRAVVAGWVWGTIFFYGTCWWLTYPMIHYAAFPAALAYVLLLLPVMFVALFPAVFCALLCRLTRRFGTAAVLLSPVVWVSFEWLRYVVTGQLWNAIGYSQAFHPPLIQSARLGGVYAISFLIIAANAAVAFVWIKRSAKSVLIGCAVFTLITVSVGGSYRSRESNSQGTATLGPAVPRPDLAVIAVQPNVPMETVDDPTERHLLETHLALTAQGLNRWRLDGAIDNGLYLGPNSDLVKKGAAQTRSAIPTLVVWPESPMSFSYSRDPHLRQVVGDLAGESHASILLNSLEPGAHGGDQNSAVMVNEKGEMSARYDKIRLMPFGEYVPLPRWLPGASSVRAIVGEFTPGSSYTLMPLGALRAGVFICIEAAHPGIARNFTNAGADVLINISNDGYLGPTPVMRQHLSNAVFRAVENNRDLLRVTNTGITAFISAEGTVSDQTTGFQEAVRTWTISKSGGGTTFYTRHGDLLVYNCALLSLGFVAASFMKRRVSEARPND